MPQDLTATLSDLIAIPSVNPMGSTVHRPEFLETRLTSHLERIFDRLQLSWRRQTIEPGRDNIIARLDGDPDKVLLWEVHQDTVPVDGMVVEPFVPKVQDGRIYGRGACDVKGGMAAMLGALARLAEDRPKGLPTVVLACCVNEEHGFTGARALPQVWSDLADPFCRRPDAAIVAEPTMLDVVVAHKGIVRWQCHTCGKASHSSRPERGDNAIYKMSRVVAAIERYGAEMTSGLGQHRLCGAPTACATMISGGISVNTVPDRCTIEIDRRLIPGEAPTTVRQMLIDFVAAETGPVSGVLHDAPYLSDPGLDDVGNRPLAERLAAAVQSAGFDGRLIGVPYGTDASKIAASGVPTVVFGPGSIDQAHTADEWLALSQLNAASEIYEQFARTFIDD